MNASSSPASSNSLAPPSSDPRPGQSQDSGNSSGSGSGSGGGNDVEFIDTHGVQLVYPNAEWELSAYEPSLMEDSGQELLFDEDEMWFTDKGENALKEVFERFDEDHDQAWNTKELQAYAVAVRDKPFTKEELEELFVAVHHDANGNLSLDGFLQWYSISTGANVEDTWKDLHKLGYDGLLHLIGSGGGARRSSS